MHVQRSCPNATNSKHLRSDIATRLVCSQMVKFSTGDDVPRGSATPGFLGIVNPENDAVYLPLKKRRDELMLALSELGGGWGFICRLITLDQNR